MTFIAIIIATILAVFGITLSLYKKVYTPMEPTATPVVPTIDPTTVTATPVPVEALGASKRVYDEAVSLLGTHIALAANVPEEEGCVTAVAFVLSQCAYSIPSSIVGVNALIDWMLAKGFKETTLPTLGCIATSHRTDRNDPLWAHCGIWGINHVMSNTSYNDKGLGLVKGDWQANMKIAIWVPFYESKYCATRYFVPV